MGMLDRSVSRAASPDTPQLNVAVDSGAFANGEPAVVNSAKGTLVATLSRTMARQVSAVLERALFEDNGSHWGLVQVTAVGSLLALVILMEPMQCSSLFFSLFLQFLRVQAGRSHRP